MAPSAMRGVGPLLSVIVLNYNGSRIMDVMRECVDSLRTMGYEDYELIFVDNGSSDGSYEAMSRYLEGAGLRRYSVVEAGRNLGFTGGNNLGFANRGRGSEFTLLLNNDAVLLPGSVGALMRRMLTDPGVGALNGMILDYRSGELSGVPSFLDELYGVVAPIQFKPEGPLIEVEETYPMGAAALLRNDAVIEANGGRERIFDEEIFMYFDDATLGLKLWNSGWRVLFHPAPLARHLGGSSSTGEFWAYHSLRGRAMMSVAAPTRYRRLAGLYLRRNYLWARRRFPRSKYDFRKAIDEGYEVGGILRDRYHLDLYRAPVVRLTMREALSKVLLSAGRVGRRKSEALSNLVRGDTVVASSLLTGGERKDPYPQPRTRAPSPFLRDDSLYLSQYRRNSA